MVLTGENGSTWIKTCFGALYTTNFAWTDVGSNPGQAVSARSFTAEAHLKTKINLAYISRFSSSRAVNVIRLCYENH